MAWVTQGQSTEICWMPSWQYLYIIYIIPSFCGHVSGDPPCLVNWFDDFSFLNLRQIFCDDFAYSDISDISDIQFAFMAICEGHGSPRASPSCTMGTWDHRGWKDWKVWVAAPYRPYSCLKWCRHMVCSVADFFNLSDSADEHPQTIMFLYTQLKCGVSTLVRFSRPITGFSLGAMGWQSKMSTMSKMATLHQQIQGVPAGPMGAVTWMQYDFKIS